MQANYYTLYYALLPFLEGTANEPIALNCIHLRSALFQQPSSHRPWRPWRAPGSPRDGFLSISEPANPVHDVDVTQLLRWRFCYLHRSNSHRISPLLVVNAIRDISSSAHDTVSAFRGIVSSHFYSSAAQILPVTVFFIKLGETDPQRSGIFKVIQRMHNKFCASWFIVPEKGTNPRCAVLY